MQCKEPESQGVQGTVLPSVDNQPNHITVIILNLLYINRPSDISYIDIC